MLPWQAILEKIEFTQDFLAARLVSTSVYKASRNCIDWWIRIGASVGRIHTYRVYNKDEGGWSRHYSTKSLLLTVPLDKQIFEYALKRKIKKCERRMKSLLEAESHHLQRFMYSKESRVLLERMMESTETELRAFQHKPKKARIELNNSKLLNKQQK